MIYVYCNRRSNGAQDLVEEVGGRRLRLYQGGRFYRREGLDPVALRDGDAVVCWGSVAEGFTPPNGVEVLNNSPFIN